MIKYPLLEALKAFYVVFSSKNVEITDNDFQISEFFFSGKQLLKAEDDFAFEIASLIREFHPYLIQFFAEKPDFNLEKLLASHVQSKKRLHVSTKEEFEMCKRFVLEKKEAFDLQKICLFMLWHVKITKKTCGLQKMTKNLKICKKILDYYQEFEQNDPNDDFFLIKPFNNDKVMLLNIIQKLLFVQTEIASSRYQDSQKSTIQLLNYSYSNQNFKFLEIETTVSLIEQYCATGKFKEAFDFFTNVFETRLPDLQLKKKDFSEEKYAKIWIDKFFYEYVEDKFFCSEENAEKYIEERLASKDNQKKTQLSNQAFALRMLGFFFLSVFLSELCFFTFFSRCNMSCHSDD